MEELKVAEAELVQVLETHNELAFSILKDYGWLIPYASEWTHPLPTHHTTQLINHAVITLLIHIIFISMSQYIKNKRTNRNRPKSAPYLRLKNSKRISKCQSIDKLGTFGDFFKISLTMPKKTERGNPLVSPGMVCYAQKRKNLFGSLPWANRYNLASS